MHTASLPSLFASRSARAGLVLLLLALALPLRAGWWNNDWTLRKQITIDTTATGAATTEDVAAQPILLRLTDGNFQFAAAKPDGSDLRFVAADDKTLLPYHIEKFDGLLNEALVWVHVPALKAGAKTAFWLYYGNTTDKAAKVEDAKATYDENAVLVYHFNERGQPANDFTMGGNNAATAGLASEGAVIGPGLRLDGQTTVAIPAAPALNWPMDATFTWSAWVKPAAVPSRVEIFSRRSGPRAFVIGLENGVPHVEVTGNGAPQRSAGGAPLAPGAWHHLAVTADGQQLTLYVDGVAYTTLGADVPALSDLSLIGGNPAQGTAFVGELDEMEIDRVPRSASAIKLAAASQGPDGSRVVVFGEDQQDAGWFAFLKGGYFGVIIGSLTLDGWVVIGVLAVMSAVSWFVMIRKGLLVGRVGKANALFLENWRHVANDLSVLDSGDADHARSLGGRSSGHDMHGSPLYRIYHIGVEEIRHRVANADQPGRAKVLTARSIQAIRAALDGGLVRETQKMNSNMVLLTIAISGGPFLGLLGTVVGVMITFAAVASAGEVNVNAIAPGIAAALLATVAGLGVAIPALFGYNYLLTQIKGASNDMHVFIDEFVTKLAEFYSDEVVIEATSGDSAH